MSVSPEAGGQLALAVMDLQRAVKRAVLNHGEPGDLSPASEGALRTLKKHQPCRASDIAEAIGAGPSALSRQVADLEERGFIQRTSDPTDGRARLLELGRAGHDYLDMIELRRTDHITQFLKHWDDQRLDTALEVISDLTSAIEEHLPQHCRDARRAGQSAADEAPAQNSSTIEKDALAS